jgi:Xaa-Pro dipeptidase
MRRRDFLLAVGASACSAAHPLLRTRRPRTWPESDFSPRVDYPPIAPLGDAVYARRRERARELARAAHADGLFATSGATNFAYLVGASFGRSERLIALWLPVDGDAFVLAPSFEVERVRRGARNLRVRGWEEHEDPIALLALEGTIAVEPRTDYAVAARLQRAHATLVDGTPLCEEPRVEKSDEELARMRRAIAITEDVFAVVFARLEAGLRESQVARLVAEEHARRGVDGGALVQFGPNAALPHGGPGDAALVDGVGVLLDGGCAFQGWQSDVTRTRWFGAAPPPARFRAIYAAVHDAQTAAIARVRPGVPAQEIDRTARAVIARAGFGAQFTHRLGHGMGMDGHEPVYLVEGNARPLTPGLVFSVEPGIYLPGELGVRLEDDVTCTATGAEVLSRRAPAL